jgi:hypothetical protein
LTDSATCPTYHHDEDIEHLLIACPKAAQVWSYFNLDPSAHDIQSLFLFASLALLQHRSKYYLRLHLLEHLEEKKYLCIQPPR